MGGKDGIQAQAFGWIGSVGRHFKTALGKPVVLHIDDRQ